MRTAPELARSAIHLQGCSRLEAGVGQGGARGALPAPRPRCRAGLIVASSEPLALLQRAVAALQRGAWAEAADLARAVLQRFGPDLNALMVLAAVRTQAGDPPGAIEFYERARALAPDHVHLLVNLAAAYRAAARLPEARRALESALQVEPRFAIAHNNLGNVLTDLGERAAAVSSYERAAALDPRYADPVAGLARMAEEEHRLEDARGFAKRALQLAPHHVLATLTLARTRFRQDEPAAAAALLETLLSSGALSLTNRILAQGYLGEAYDRLARYEEAFAAFSEANSLQHAQYASAFSAERGPLVPASIARLTQLMQAADPAAWGAAPPAARVPVFLIGFPRSGTTLLDQMLASHPEVTTLEERDNLIDVARELLGSEESLQGWGDLAAEQIERLRELYWRRVDSGAQDGPMRRVFIDKQPLNAALLPLIYRLFPSAPIILALRDPRDVVLSCYQQRFGMNVAMYQLLRLDTSSAYYDLVMRLVAVSRAKLPLRVHTVKYEAVVGNFEMTLRELLGFLGLGWDEGVRAYTATARKRTIGTPSAAQVVRPLYGSACGKWRHYAPYLGPCTPLLAPWVEAFGYDPK